MKMYKDGITREVDKLQEQSFKEDGWIEVKAKEEQPKQENVEVVSKKVVRKKV